MAIKYNEMIQLIDFLSARFGYETNSYMEERDDIIADSFEFIESKRK